MKTIKICMMAAAATAMLAMSSCREQSDNLLSYGMNDDFSFSEANSSFEGQFKAVWKALNANYGIWDYEAQHGLDWDAVYDQYLPVFQGLDKCESVSNDTLQKIYEDVLCPLHDGHMYVQIKNLKTQEYLRISPANLRNADREDYDMFGFFPNLNYYEMSNTAGENQIVAFDRASTLPNTFINNEIRTALSDINARIAELESKESRTDLDEYFLAEYEKAKQTFETFSVSSMQDVQYYNDSLTTQYQYLGITLAPFTIDSVYWMQTQYACFNGGIAYFGLSGFFLTAYLQDMVTGDSATRIKEVWRKWFEAVQDLQASGQLKGVIIDIRSNGGGMVNDYQFVLGSLLPAGGHQIAQARFKTGVGRYDYSPLTPERMETLPSDSFGDERPFSPVTSVPIVVLANCWSVSMAEITCLGAKNLANGCVIGTQTWGGMCLLTKDPSAYSQNYASCVGVEDQTPFYAYIPANVTITNEGGILEGVGVTPDIEVKFDRKLFSETGRDSQLERALQYIRTGK